MQIASVADLGATVRTHRQNHGMTQTQFAQSIGVTQEWLSRFENGRMRNPGFAAIMAAFRKLELKLTILEPNIALENDGSSMTKAGKILDRLKRQDPAFLRSE